jgi:NitT/TauT family transport system substrate-binding protein
LKAKVGLPSIDIDALPIVIPQEKGFFAEEGLDVEVIRISANNSVVATFAGDLDFFTAMGSGITAAATQGMPFKVIAVAHGTPMDAIVGRRDARTIADLRGGTIAVSSPGATMDLLSREVIRRAGMEPGRDVNTLSVGEEPNRLAALKVGQVDAAILGPPVIFEAEAEGYNVLADVGDAVPIAVNGVVATEETVRQRPDLVRRFLRAYLRGLAFMWDSRPETVRFIQDAEDIRDPALAQKSYDRMVKTLSRDGTVPDANVRSYVDLSILAGRLTADQAPAAMATIDFAPVRAAAGEPRR